MAAAKSAVSIGRRGQKRTPVRVLRDLVNLTLLHTCTKRKSAGIDLNIALIAHKHAFTSSATGIVRPDQSPGMRANGVLYARPEVQLMHPPSQLTPMPARRRLLPSRQNPGFFPDDETSIRVTFSVKGRENMAGISGGPATANGVGYQHIVALEEVVTYVERGQSGWAFFSESTDDDVVDFGFRSPEGTLERLVQAKSAIAGPEGRHMTVSDVLQIFGRLVQNDADSYVLRTNRPLAASVQKLDVAFSNLREWHSNSPHLAPAIRSAIHANGGRIDPALPTVAVERLARCRVITDEQVLPGIIDDVADRVLNLRRSRGWGIGRDSASILTHNLAMRLLKLSAGDPGRMVDTSEIDQMLFPADRTVAQAHGAYDWGAVIGNMPNTDTVGRPNDLGFLKGAFPGVPGRRPRRVVLSGFSGAGKSTLSATYAHSAAASYDHVLWIDATDASTIRHGVGALLGAGAVSDGNMRADEDEPDLESAFRAVFTGNADTWLLIFDNASSADGIRGWCPTQGHVDLIATSTNGVSWTGWAQHEVGALDREVSTTLIAKRLQLDQSESEWRAAAGHLAECLDDWPLTIELACAYLNAADRGLDFAPAYVKLLMAKVIDDELLVPGEYSTHRTLFQAVLVALEGLESRHRINADGGIDRYSLSCDVLSALSYLPGRSAHAEIAVSAGVRLRGGTGASTAELIDETMRCLREFSLANLTVGPAAHDELSAFRVNEAVLHVVRARHSAQRREQVLDAVVTCAHETLKHAIDHDRSAAAVHVVPSATSAVRWALTTGVLSRYAIVLVGNLSVVWSALHRPEISLEYYALELELLDHADHAAPILRAKINSAIACLRAGLDHPIDDVLDAAQETTQYLRSWPSEDSPDERNKVLYQLIDVCDMVLRNPGEASFAAERIHAIRDELATQRGGFGSAIYENRRRARSLLDEPGHDLEALRLIDDVIADPNCPSDVRRHTMGMRVEALTHLGRIQEAVFAAHTASQEAIRDGFGIEDVSNSLINAWLAMLPLLLGPDVGSHVPLVSTMLELFDGVTLSGSEDQARLDACRFVSVAFEADLDGEVQLLIERMASNPITPSRTVRSQNSIHALIDSANALVGLRRRNGNAVLVRGGGWGRTSSLGGDTLLLLWPDAAALQYVSAMPPQATGDWEIDSRSILLRVHTEPVILIAFPRWDLGWFQARGAQGDVRRPEVQRLEEVLRSAVSLDVVGLVAVAAGGKEAHPLCFIRIDRPLRDRDR